MNVSPLYLRDAARIDPHGGAILRGNFLVERGAGGELHPTAAIPDPAEVLDCHGGLVTRAFAVAHHHIYSALARGMPSPQPPPSNFREILERVWWRLDRALDADVICACAQVTAVDLLKAGATFVIDHHSSPHAAAGSLDLIAQTLDSAGVGHLLCLELSDRDGPAALAAGLHESERFAATRKALIGLHASFTVSDALLAQAVALAKNFNTGVHIHVAEAEADQDETLARHGRRVVHRLADAGALDLPHTLLAHGLHLDASERAAIAASRAWVVQNPESNRHNNVGTFDARGLGERILLGTDGMHSDMLASLRAAYFDGQTTGGLAPQAAWQRLHRVDDYLAQLGVFRDNDLVVLDYDAPTPLTADNLEGHAVYGFGQQHVRHVVAQGRVVVQDREVRTLDEAKVRANARLQAARLWQAM